MALRADLPDWPRRMDAETAAAYLNIGESTLREGWPRGRYPAPIKDGKRVLWDRRVQHLAGFSNHRAVARPGGALRQGRDVKALAVSAMAKWESGRNIEAAGKVAEKGGENG